MSPRSRRTATPLDRLEEIRGKRIALAHQRDEWSRRRGEAERALAELPDKRREAMRAQARGEDADVPEGGRFQAIVAEAIERDAAIRVEERDLTEEEHAIIDSDLPFFDRLDVEAIQKAGATLEQAVGSIRAAEVEVRAARSAHLTVRVARIRRGEQPPQEMLATDFAGGVLEITEARRIMRRYEEIMLGYQERREAPPARAKLTNAQARPHFEVIG